MITKKQNSKLIAALLSVIMVVAFMPQMAFAEGNDTWSSITASGVTVSVSTTTELLTISGSGNQYQITSTQSGYFPKHFSMKVEPNAEVTGTNGAKFEYYNAPYGVVTMGEAATVLTVTLNGNSFTINCPAPNGGSSAGAGLEAYLPGYGQFANEGINAGGWGDGYVAQTTGKKAMVNAIAQTGLSLGSFGGYAVLKFDTPIENSPNNPYGIDFILYGNAFVGNSEPGCVQVSQDGSTWYDIAGSKHYADDTVWNCTATYTNPRPDDNSLPAPPANPNNVTGTAYTSQHPYTLSYTARPWQTEPTTSLVNVAYNTWHNHSWFPLEANYFNSRSGNPALANLALCAHFATYTNGELKLKGTKIAFPSTSGNDYAFGYCDVHPNGSNYGTAVNPYTAVANTQGGDGIDISWAVNANGEPVNLSDIQYVRVYTGVATMNPQYPEVGEVSTEVTGVYNVTPQAAAVGVAYQSSLSDGENTYEPVAVNGSNTQGMTLIQQEPGTMVYNIAADVADVYLNGIKVEENEVRISNNMMARFDGENLTVEVSLGENDTQYLQIITQPNGDEEAYINLVKFTSN